MSGTTTIEESQPRTARRVLSAITVFVASSAGTLATVALTMALMHAMGA